MTQRNKNDKISFIKGHLRSGKDVLTTEETYRIYKDMQKFYNAESVIRYTTANVDKEFRTTRENALFLVDVFLRNNSTVEITEE